MQTCSHFQAKDDRGSHKQPTMCSQTEKDTSLAVPAGMQDSPPKLQPLSPASHALAVAAICLCMAAQSWLLISVFPYSGFMAIRLIPHLNEETAGSYAGLIASAFMVGRTITSYGWGKVADAYGRKFVLISSLFFSSVCSVLFGMSPTFGLALLWRFFLGFFNGLVGTAKTSISEVAYGDDLRETRGMGIAMGMWGWGFLFSPALSGLLSEPAKQHPNSWLVQSFPILSDYPFILPNLVSVAFCLTAATAVVLFVPETLPANKIQSPKKIPEHLYHYLCSMMSSRSQNDGSTQETKRLVPNTNYGALSQSDSLGPRSSFVDDEESCEKEAIMNHAESCSMLSTNSPRRSFSKPVVPPTAAPALPALPLPKEHEAPAPAPATMSSLWSRPETRIYLLIYWLYSFAAVAVDEAFPLFCISLEAGLGLDEFSIGQILSGSGLLYACCQYFVYAAIVERFGLERSIRIGAFASGPLVSLIPASLLWRTSGGGFSRGGYAYLSLVFAAYRVFGSVFFSSVSVAINRTVEPSHRGTANGLSMLGGSFAKGLGPTFAGILVAFCISSGWFPPHVGAVMIWVVIGMTGLTAAILATIAVPKQNVNNA